MDNNILFPVQENLQYGIVPGRDERNVPVIAFLGDDSVIFALFDNDGRYVDAVAAPIMLPVVESVDDKLHEVYRNTVHDLLRDQGFSSFATVQVEQFWLHEFAVGITPAIDSVEHAHQVETFTQGAANQGNQEFVLIHAQ